MEPELSIIIVNWNGEKFLPDCLKSIADNPPSVSYEVIVIDNDSSDGSPQWLGSDEPKRMFPEGNFNFIKSEENLGFGRANNLVIEQTKTPFVFLLNPDTIVKPGSIETLLETLQLDIRIGIAIPKVVDLNGVVQPSVWAVPTATKLIVEGLGLYRLIPRKLRGEWLLFRHWSYDKSRNVPLASGCAMMAKRKMIENVGTFDPAIFMYGEDLEWCYRMGANGWHIRFDPRAVIIHIGGQSSKSRWSLIESRLKEERSWIEFQHKCLLPFSVFVNSLVRVFTLYPRVLVRKITGKDAAYLNQLIPMQYESMKTVVRKFIAE